MDEKKEVKLEDQVKMNDDMTLTNKDNKNDFKQHEIVLAVVYLKSIAKDKTDLVVEFDDEYLLTSITILINAMMHKLNISFDNALSLIKMNHKKLSETLGDVKTREQNENKENK